jgi:transposase
VKAFLEMTSRGRLSAEAMDGVISGASTTLGVPMLEEEERLVRSLAASVVEAMDRLDQSDEDISRIGADDKTFTRLAPWMGAYTAGVLISRCDPQLYSSARQFEKACGLNLREKSSGEFHGRLHITKRGPGLVRQVLFLFALRTIATSKITHAWYVTRRGYSEDSKKRAVVAVMRKLVKAIFHVARGNAFDESKLFDVRRLDLTKSSPKAPTKPEPRTKPRSIARGTKRGGARASAST